jgi:hypothetical protein
MIDAEGSHMTTTEAIAPTRRTPAPTSPQARPIPLSARKKDIAILVFYWINLLFITYVVDVEQLTLPDLHAGWTYPLWPPKAAIDVIHWYGSNFDPLLMARPVWWKMTIWIDSLLFGPYYAVAIYAFTKGKDWIRIPSIVQASFLIAIVLIILGEETWGEHATPNLLFVYGDNLPWLVFPIMVIARMYKSERPFTAGPAGAEGGR